jgi:hypothetical protein
MKVSKKVIVFLSMTLMNTASANQFHTLITQIGHSSKTGKESLFEFRELLEKWERGTINTPNPNETIFLDRTPLHLAVSENKLEFVKLLCASKKIEKNSRDTRLRTPLQVAMNLLLEFSEHSTGPTIREDYFPIIKQLIKTKKVDIQVVTHSNKDIIRHRNDSLNFVDNTHLNYGNNLLHLAALTENKELWELVIKVATKKGQVEALLHQKNNQELTPEEIQERAKSGTGMRIKQKADRVHPARSKLRRVFSENSFISSSTRDLSISTPDQTLEGEPSFQSKSEKRRSWLKATNELTYHVNQRNLIETFKTKGKDLEDEEPQSSKKPKHQSNGLLKMLRKLRIKKDGNLNLTDETRSLDQSSFSLSNKQALLLAYIEADLLKHQASESYLRDFPSLSKLVEQLDGLDPLIQKLQTWIDSSEHKCNIEAIKETIKRGQPTPKKLTKACEQSVIQLLDSVADGVQAMQAKSFFIALEHLLRSDIERLKQNGHEAFSKLDSDLFAKNLLKSTFSLRILSIYLSKASLSLDANKASYVRGIAAVTQSLFATDIQVQTSTIAVKPATLTDVFSEFASGGNETGKKAKEKIDLIFQFMNEPITLTDSQNLAQFYEAYRTIQMNELDREYWKLISGSLEEELEKKIDHCIATYSFIMKKALQEELEGLKSEGKTKDEIKTFKRKKMRLIEDLIQQKLNQFKSLNG